MKLKITLTSHWRSTIHIWDMGNGVLLSSWDIPMATTISVHNTYVCHLQMKDTYRNQPEIYFVDNDAEYVLCVDFRCLRYSFKTIWNELPIPWLSNIFRGFNIICKWYLIQRPCRWRLSCYCIICCLSVPFYISMFLHVWDLYFFILPTISRLEPVTLIQDFQRGKSW